MKKKIFLGILLLLLSLGIYWIYCLSRYADLLSVVLEEDKEKTSYFIDEKRYNPNKVKYKANILFFYIIAKKENANLDFVKFMIDKGFDVNDCSEDTFCPIFAAVVTKNIKLVDLLLENGGDVNILYKNEAKPLSLALQVRDCDMVRLLVKKGASLDGIRAKDGFEQILEECYNTAEEKR